MAGTRSSTRNQSSNPATPEKQSPGQKRKGAPSPSPRSGHGRKQQKTLEECAPDDSDMRAAMEKAENEQKEENEAKAGEDASSELEEKVDEDVNGESKEPVSSGQEGNESAEAVQRSPERAENIPSNILEKGIFYFLARGRVGVDNPESVQDLARSYLVLRPLPKDAKLTEGPLEDLKNNRLLALPKKVMPKSHRDAFMVFVEKAGTTIQDLKENFMKGSEYETKTTGLRHTPPMTPLVEGVYAITSVGRSSHFAYNVTIPGEVGEVPQDMGFYSKGSFVCSVKNPDQKGPANVQLPQAPDFPEEVMKEFHGLRWMGLQPKHLDYANTQLLLIGEGRDELGKAVEPTEKDKKHEKETPEEEVSLLEDEDSHRTGKLNGDDSVFEDLGISKKEFPAIRSTW